MKKREKRLKTVYSDSFKKGGERPFDRTYSRLNREFNLPEKYGTNELVLMVVDSSTLYAYWEIEEEVFKKIEKKAGGKGKRNRSLKRVLRAYEVREFSIEDGSEKKLDVVIKSSLGSCYIVLPAFGKKWAVEIGLVSETGRFFFIIKSKEVRIQARSTVMRVPGSMNLVAGGVL